MPHTKRIIEPVLVSRGHVDPNARDELESMTNNTLANVIRELSSLSRHAEDMFRELSQETASVFRRGTQLQRRIENVREKVTQLNPNVDVLNLEGIHLQKHFKSSIVKEQQVLSRSTVPRAILEVYERCDATPALDKLDQFREDGKSSMKFYTDPSYFAELWAKEMGKQIAENKNELQKKRKKKPHEQKRTQQPIREAQAHQREKFQRTKDGVDVSEHYADPAIIKAKIEKGQKEAAMRRNDVSKREHDATQTHALQEQQEQQRLMYQQQQQQETLRQQQQQQQLQYQQQQRQMYEQQLLQQQQQQQWQQQQQLQHHHQQQLYNDQTHPYPQQSVMDGGQGYPSEHNNINNYNHQQPLREQQRLSPDKLANGMVGNRKNVNLPSPNRPMAPPPAPPGQGGNRDSLPPPPSPPPPDMSLPPPAPHFPPQDGIIGGEIGRMPSQRDSPARQGSYGSRQDTTDLPSPPPSPPRELQPGGMADTSGSMLHPHPRPHLLHCR